MRMFKWGLLAVGIVCAGMMLGCEDSDDDDGGGSGELAGTWSGKVCGRNLTMVINQNGSNLSGTYTLSDPEFSESMSGSANVPQAPASAVLNGGGDRRFEINFSSPTQFSGGYYKGATKVCNVTATKL